jgi:hypothetical protein
MQPRLRTVHAVVWHACQHAAQRAGLQKKGPSAHTEALFWVLRFRLLQDASIGVGVFPKREGVLEKGLKKISPGFHMAFMKSPLEQAYARSRCSIE